MDCFFINIGYNFGFSFFNPAYPAAENIKVTPADKADVQIIENKAKTLWLRKADLTKEITIGKLQEGASIFNGLGGAVVTSDGHIIALDSKDKKIKIFDATGQKLKEFGQEGQGPGEWTSPNYYSTYL